MTKHKQILSWFQDTPDDPFSLHALMEYASRLGEHKPGDWFGPAQVAVLIRLVVAFITSPELHLCREALGNQLQKTRLSDTMNAYVAHDCTGGCGP